MINSDCSILEEHSYFDSADFDRDYRVAADYLAGLHNK